MGFGVVHWCYYDKLHLQLRPEVAHIYELQVYFIVITPNPIFNLISLLNVTVLSSGTLSPKILTSLLLFWCPYMVINVSVQYNGGLLPDIILLTLCDSIGEPF